jgi:O-antigen ligase
MIFSQIRKKYPWLFEYTITILVFLCAFTLPLSATLKSIFFPWLVIACFFLANFHKQFRYVICQQPVILTLLFFLWVTCGFFYGNGDSGSVIVSYLKYVKLLSFPFFMVALSNKQNKQSATLGLLLSMLVTFLVGLLRHHGYLTQYFESEDNLFRNHIITSLYMSYAAFYCYINYLKIAKNGAMYSLKSVCFLVLFIIFSFDLFFLNGGRMGYISFALLISYGSICRLGLKKMNLVMMILGVFLTFSYFESAYFKIKINETFTETMTYFSNENKDTSIGYRFQFHAFAKELWLEHPIIGQGLGGYHNAFITRNPVPAWTRESLEPHQQYWLILSEQGMIGLLLYLCILLSILKSCDLKRDNDLILSGFILSFILGSMTDSLLFYSGPGYFFLWIVALHYPRHLLETEKAL